MENEKDLTWNRQMLTLIQEMIHENNTAPADGIAEEKIADFEARCDSIVQTAEEEYEAPRRTITGMGITCICGW